MAGVSGLPDLATLIAPKDPEQLGQATRAQLPELTGLAGKSKIPVGPIEQGQEGFAKQQVKLLSAKLAPPAPTETNVAPTVTVASQKAPSADLEDTACESVVFLVVSQEQHQALFWQQQILKQHQTTRNRSR